MFTAQGVIGNLVGENRANLMGCGPLRGGYPRNRYEVFTPLVQTNWQCCFAKCLIIKQSHAKMLRAFVSHSTFDDSYVAEMESFLRALGFDDVFNDASAIIPDEETWPVIKKGIASCDAFVVVITFAFDNAVWGKREVEYARSISKKIIPVWIEDCPLPQLFADRDVIDFRPRNHAERRIDISRIFEYAPPELIGRGSETNLINDAWQKALRTKRGRPRLLTFVALGGEGKTSLVAKWAADLVGQDWPGCNAAFAWSFYSQGARERIAASSDLFLKEALTFFGDDTDKQFANSPAGAYEKGQRLAHIIGRKRNLLILDGLEPLQYSPASPMRGMLKDQGIAVLLKCLAADSCGLCVITTRYSITDLRAFWPSIAQEENLLRLSRANGVHLLRSLGVKGSEIRNIPIDDGLEQANEFEKLVEDVKGHALTLNLLGTYLRDAHAGDIRKRDLVKLEEVDAEEQGGHVFRVMEAYERQFDREGPKGRRAAAVLRILGLFDRPLTSECLHVLLEPPIMFGLTEPLLNLTEAQQNLTFARLENAKLLTVKRDASGVLKTLDAHPLLREFFASQLRTQEPDAWHSAHRRLYDYLCTTTQEGNRPTLETLQPLYQAVTHGCLAGLFVEARTKILRDRIQRNDEYYSFKQLGAFGSDVCALACFFEEPWNRVTCMLPEEEVSLVFSQTAFCLRALGRLGEAVDPMRHGLELRIRNENWLNAAIGSSNLSELELTVGEVADSLRDAALSVKFGDISDDIFWKMTSRCKLGDAQHQAGYHAKAHASFREGEELQSRRQPSHPTLYSVQGFRYCDLLLAGAERAAWQTFFKEFWNPNDTYSDSCFAVEQRAEYALEAVSDCPGNLLDGAINHLTLGRTALYRAILCGSSLETPSLKIKQAVSGLRSAGQRWFLPSGIMTQAWSNFLSDARTGSDSAKANLEEAEEIAAQGQMLLFMADIHLHRARLFFRETKYPWVSPQADLAAAEKIIRSCGYHRRDEELADARAAILLV